ncbi:MAG: Gfo/Idh/MocA family oxidoreductase [Planctomycetaceae bacterium]
MNRKHRLLVIGTGSIGERHLRCFLTTGRAEVEFVEVNDSLRQTIAERYPSAKPLESIDDALDQLPDLAVICTPAQFHVPMATRLAEAGIHLLIEKPLSISLEGIPELLAAVARRNVRAGIAYVYRAHPILTAMRQAIQSGRFGQPVELIAVGGQHFPTYRPAYRHIYYTKRETGGGAIQDAITHIFNAGEWLVGPMDRLVCDAAHQVLEGVQVEDTVHVLARHGNVLANYSLNQYQAPNESTITVVCERGTCRFESHEHRWRWMTEPGSAWHDEVFPPLERDTMFIAQANQILDVVEAKADPACSLAEGVQTLKVNLAALTSLESGRWETIR